MLRTIRCKCEELEVALGMDEAGRGSTVVLLPALSSISTRAEIRPLFDRLAPGFRVVTVDWPGFGVLPRPRADWTPEILSAFLNWFLSEIVPPPHAVVAAGHAATYALFHAAYRPNAIDRLVLIAPTWRGPFPTMMRGYRPWFARVRDVLDYEGIGSLLYRLNVSRFVVPRWRVSTSTTILSGYPAIACARNSPSRELPEQVTHPSASSLAASTA